MPDYCFPLKQVTVVKVRVHEYLFLSESVICFV